MTPYGALESPDRLAAGEYRCPCPVCQGCENWPALFDDVGRLAEHNLRTICTTVWEVRKRLSQGTFPALLREVIQRHSEWFPQSALARTWEA
jgi:queuine/archaeosine tRNA-ribosyltransferase